jgi:hypothetical protein
MNSELFGIWRTDPDDPQTQVLLGIFPLSLRQMENWNILFMSLIVNR